MVSFGGEDDAPQVRCRETLFAALGMRIRDIRQGPDGRLYLLTDGEQARMIRLNPGQQCLSRNDSGPDQAARPPTARTSIGRSIPGTTLDIELFQRGGNILG